MAASVLFWYIDDRPCRRSQAKNPPVGAELLMRVFVDSAS
jgi:hypothetical protein